MRIYDLYEYKERDEYGQQRLSTEPKGKVKISINITSQNIQANINYSGATYVGFTHSLLEDTNAIKYGDKFLKVLYVNPKGRLKQVFMAEL